MIIVHDGRAHEDDFLATCVLIYKTNQRALRTKFTSEHLENSEYWVVDQGLSFNPELHNFDHHHIKEEICGFTMVLDYFYGKDYREDFPQLRFVEIYDSYGSKSAAKFAKVSEESLSIINSPIRNSIISVFSKITGEINDPMYSVMKEIGKSICEEIENCKKLMQMIENGVQYYSFENIKILDVTNCKLDEGFKIENLPTRKYCKDKKIEVDVVLTIDSRNSNGGYRMVSNNVDVIKFLPNEKSYFCHNSGFLIAFNNLDDYKQILVSHIEKSKN
jgi:hypothetical protein